MRSSSTTGKSAADKKRIAAKERVRRHRETLRSRGLRPVQIWVPDTRKPAFLSKYRSQLEKISAHARELADAGLLPVTEEDLAGWAE
jgi:antidote-toxin recognition MazE-like antitoxin